MKRTGKLLLVTALLMAVLLSGCINQGTNRNNNTTTVQAASGDWHTWILYPYGPASYPSQSSHQIPTSTSPDEKQSTYEKFYSSQSNPPEPETDKATSYADFYESKPAEESHQSYGDFYAGDSKGDSGKQSSSSEESGNSYSSGFDSSFGDDSGGDYGGDDGGDSGGDEGGE